MEIKVKDFNLNYDRKSNKYIRYFLNDELDIVIYKRYELNFAGNISQNILNDIIQLAQLGYRLNPYLNRD